MPDLNYLFVVLGVALVSWLMIGWLIRFLTARSIVDTPNERTLHEGAVPRGGGLVIASLLIAALVLGAVFSSSPQTFLALAVLTGFWAGLGWADDTRDLSPFSRFAVQLSLALVVVFLFGYVSVVYVTHDLYLPLGVAGAIISVIGVLWLANLYNFMDGMDGLAASQTVIAALTLGFWSYQFGDTWMVLSLLVLAAASYGFLLHNWHPASIFMGDVGSTVIGAFFATVILIFNIRYGVPILALVLLFAVFVADASLTLLRRMLRREKFWLPHRSHYYQRLAALGIDHNKIVLGYIVLMLICSLLATLAATAHDRIPHTYLGAAGLLGIAIALVARLERRRA